MEVSTTQKSNALTLSDSELIGVLQSSLYPGAALVSIKLVIDYCKASGLDPMQKPVHIVPMWSAKEGRMVDVIMPGVNLYRTQAARSGQFAGMSEPEFGPEIKANIGGQEISYPEWCKITVKRILSNSVIAEFTAIEYWLENYAVKGGKDKSIAPNAMWLKRPRGQISKCAAAQALRIAFPEIASQPTADEMEGKQLYQNEVDVTPKRQNAAAIAQQSISAPEVSNDELLCLVADMEAVADNGSEELESAWNRLDKPRKKALAPHMPRIKELAEAKG